MIRAWWRCHYHNFSDLFLSLFHHFLRTKMVVTCSADVAFWQSYLLDQVSHGWASLQELWSGMHFLQFKQHCQSTEREHCTDTSLKHTPSTCCWKWHQLQGRSSVSVNKQQSYQARSTEWSWTKGRRVPWCRPLLPVCYRKLLGCYCWHRCQDWSGWLPSLLPLST